MTTHTQDAQDTRNEQHAKDDTMHFCTMCHFLHHYGTHRDAGCADTLPRAYDNYARHKR